MSYILKLKNEMIRLEFILLLVPDSYQELKEVLEKYLKNLLEHYYDLQPFLRLLHHQRDPRSVISLFI